MTSSNQMNLNLVQSLQQFSQCFIDQFQQVHQELPKIKHDKDWPSPCEQAKIETHVLAKDKVYWQPIDIEANDGLDFDNIESALALILHKDIKEYFTTIYSEALDANCEEGDLTLLFAWNKDDFQRLQENIIGHILMKQRLKQAETVFFAVTDEEDMIITINNETGAVWVERVGCEPHKKLADSLAQFLTNIIPRVS